MFQDMRALFQHKTRFGKENDMLLSLKRIPAAVAALLFAFQTSAHAGFADDWLANSTISSPSYFAGQKRGYLSAGGFSGRWKTSNDYPLTVTPPRIKAGCGGIDAFWGGMSFLQPQYLVEKLERIVQNAPAVALDLALNVMCEPCKNAMETMEAAVNRLNQLQLDDCKATKAIVAKTAQSMGAKNGELNDIVADFEVSTNLVDGYKNFQDNANSGGSKPSGSSVSGAVSDCDDEIKAIFVTQAEAHGKSSILTNISTRLGMDISYAQLLAGMVGDIGIDKDATSGFSTYDIPFCEQNRRLNVDGLFSDKPYLRDFNDPNGQCPQATDTNANIMQYVNLKTAAITDKMKGRAALTSDEEAFINYSSGMAFNALKLSVEIDTVDSVRDVINRIIAKDITRHMLNDLYSKGEAMLSKAEEVIGKKDNSTTDNPHRCQLSLFDGAETKIKEMKIRIAALRDELNKGYQKELEQVNTLTSFIREHEAAAKRFDAEVSRRFGNQLSLIK